MSYFDIDVDTYNSSADSGFDNADFRGSDRAERAPVGARSGDNQPTNRDAMREDRQATQAEQTGRIAKNEAQGLKNDLRENERDVQGYTRSKKVDAYKQERAVDRTAEQAMERDERT